MKNIRILVYFVIFMSILVLYDFANNKVNYSTSIISYTENISHIKYPQIKGLKDKRKQNTINKLLKDQILFGVKNYLGETFVDFSYPNIKFEFESGVGLTNNYISSFWYSFFSYDEDDSGFYGLMGYTDRFFCLTIDMETGKKINLSDFMVIDERLINSTDGSNLETDYNREANPTYHKFKDAFMVYTSENEKDSYHIYTPSQIISILTDVDGETRWYIDEQKNIVFCNGANYINIPYTQISTLIYPKYFNIMER